MIQVRQHQLNCSIAIFVDDGLHDFRMFVGSATEGGRGIVKGNNQAGERGQFAGGAQ